jgi:hypothetical protein
MSAQTQAFAQMLVSTCMLQSLILRLVENGVLSRAEAERVFLDAEEIVSGLPSEVASPTVRAAALAALRNRDKTI